MTTQIIYTLVVTCCDHPDNEYDWISGAVWASYWTKGAVVRDAMMMISQIVPLSPNEPVRYLQDWDAAGRSVNERVRVDEGEPSRERVREACAGCGTTLTMRDDTWNQLSRVLEDIEGLWRPTYVTEEEGGLEATMSLHVLKRLAEELGTRRRDNPGQV